jgi:hypothetical protein
VSRTASLAPGTYIVQSRARFHGDTLTLAGGAGSFYARLTTPHQTPDTKGVYTGYVNAVSPRLYAPGTASPQVELALQCYCRNGTDAFGQPRYETATLGGRYVVSDLGLGRAELRQTDGTAIDTLQQQR